MDDRISAFARALVRHTEQTVGVVFLDPQGRYILVSSALAAANHMGVDEAVGLHPRDVAPDLWAQAEASLARTLEGEPQTFEVSDRATKANGEPRLMRVHAFPVYLDSGDLAGVGMTVQDIRVQRSGELALEGARRRAAVATVAERALSGTTSIRELCEVASSVVASTLGVPISRVVGPTRGSNEVVMLGGVGLDWLLEPSAPLRAGSFVDYVMHAPAPVIVDDLPRETRFRPPEPLLESGVSSSIAVALRDGRGAFGMLSAHSKVSRHFSDDDATFLAEVGNVLSLAVQAQEAMTFQRELISITSHEMRTPLTTIVGIGQRLQRQLAKSGTDDLGELASMVVDEGLRLNSMIDRWLGVTEVYTGREAREPGAVDLVALVSRCVSLAAERHPALGLSAVFPDEAVHLVTDGSRVAEIFDNLVENAVRHAGPTATVTVRVRHVPQDRRVFVSVEDDGPGMTPEVACRVFERFYRGSNVSRGLGVGLYVSRALAEELGGTLDVESAPGRGACFTLALPAVPVHELT